MNTKNLERNIKSIIKTGSGYGPEYLPILKQTVKVLKKINTLLSKYSVENRAHDLHKTLSIANKP